MMIDGTITKKVYGQKREELTRKPHKFAGRKLLREDGICT